MTSRLQIGTAKAEPGKLVYGALEAVELPSGNIDSLPIMIAQGLGDGPVLWLTASIHGNEYTGVSVIHQLLTTELAARLRGTVVAVPALNPAGLRSAQRIPYYLNGQDPNRLFPAFAKHPAPTPESPPSALEEAYTALFEHIRASASYLIDLHNYSIGALSFALRDPIYYRNGRDRAAAQELQKTTSEMLVAYGHSIINEYASTDYIKMNLHRSTSGAALNTARIPAFTAELGGYLTVDQVIVKGAVIGLRNVLRWAEMLDGPTEAITGIKLITPGYPVRRVQHPFAPRGGILQYFVRAGDSLKAGDVVARLTDIYGRALGAENGAIRTEVDGTVLGVSLGAVCYKNEPLLSLAIRDDSEMIQPMPG